MVIVVDGWSEASLTRGALRFGEMGAARTDWLTLTPADVNAVAALAARDPAAVRSLFARLVTPDPTLRCDPDGCSSEQGSFTWNDLADPSTGPQYGRQFAGWGITDGVFVATIDLDDAVLQHGSSSVRIQRLSDDTGVRALGYGLGQLFVMEPLWMEGEIRYKANDPTGNRESKGINPLSLFRGLGAEVAEAEGLSASLLTWRTSPTIGCGAGALCVPGQVDAAVTDVSEQRHLVCNGSRKAAVDLVSVNVDYTYPAPTHQFGLWPSWGNAAVGGRDILWVFDVPFVEGAQSQRHSLALLYGENGLVDVVGQVKDFNFPGGVTDEERTHVYQPNEIANLFPGWAAC